LYMESVSPASLRKVRKSLVSESAKGVGSVVVPVD
jgi:hypothetical protein